MAAPRVAVVGGGIGGLAAAGFLHRAGFPVTVYEQARRLAEVGAGLLAALRLAVPAELVRLGARCVGVETGGERSGALPDRGGRAGEPRRLRPRG